MRCLGHHGENRSRGWGRIDNYNMNVLLFSSCTTCDTRQHCNFFNRYDVLICAKVQNQIYLSFGLAPSDVALILVANNTTVTVAMTFSMLPIMSIN
ncbi:hypothetical protein K503DRAFT_629839 [Rhizopogon vinicolor AM-OR11-026]|uniref:Uncharacterized protein n=1 Tax=Rhizopogon vinicolor AM-OR11-026 TaxID=1314800 RepID=A0A1B7MHV2_9AGAM|nr:hypothetical protein K503DRAFT_629839 [Rhizopogon vinicolor AM-OR11-026]